MKTMRKPLCALLLCALLLTAVLPAGLAEVTYPLDTDVTLTLAWGLETQWSTYYETLADTPLFQQLMKDTGVKIVTIHPTDFNLMFASGDLPDMFYSLSSYTGGANKAIADGIVYPITDLVAEYAPTLNALLESDPEYHKAAYTANGDLPGFPAIGIADIATNGFMARADWLEELGMDVPQTPDEFYDMLVAFRDEMGAKIPLTLNQWWLFEIVMDKGGITTPFGLPKCGWYHIDGKVGYGQYSENYRELLAWVRKLYEEGLLDQNFATVDGNTINANMMDGTSGVTWGNCGGGLGSYLTTMAEKDPEYDLVAIGSLVANDGDKAMCSYKGFTLGISGMTAITTACENKEVAAMFLDYAYTEAGHMLYNFGIEGESYEMIDGEPIYTDLILNNPDGLTKQQALSFYTRSWSGGPMVKDVRYQNQYTNLPRQVEAMARWGNSDALDYILPAISMSTDDSTEFARLMSDISTYVAEMTIGYISGTESLDDYDAFMETLNAMGIEDAIALQQKALDAYNNR